MTDSNSLAKTGNFPVYDTLRAVFDRIDKARIKARWHAIDVCAAIPDGPDPVIYSRFRNCGWLGRARGKTIQKFIAGAAKLEILSRDERWHLAQAVQDISDAKPVFLPDEVAR